MIHNVKITMNELEQLIVERGLESNGKVQQFIDSEVMRLTDPYVPMDSGALKRSVIEHTKVGSGEVNYRTPYARRLYYNPQYTYAGAPMRGGRWFERMKADQKDTILRGAAKISGGEAK